MRGSHLVIGVAVVVMGYALTIIAMARQAELGTPSGPVPACIPADTVARAPLPSSSAEPGSTTSPAGASTPIAPTGSANPTASAAPAGNGDAVGDSQDNRLFKFSPGGATMSREEQVRVFTLGKAVARHPTAKVSIEGFGDVAGTDALMMGIAKHRAKAALTLLSKAGVTEDRVTLTFSDMGSDTRLARSIRVTTTPPISEVEKP